MSTFTALRDSSESRHKSAEGQHFVVLGAGVAGLAAARELIRCGCRVTVVERELEVGGLARTIERAGFRFDIGGHRFHSNNEAVVDWLKQLLKKDLLVAPRQSHIYMQGQFVKYPVEFPGALSIFSPVEALQVLGSYLLSRVTETRRPDISFEDWVVKRYGKKLYEAFFQPYTEKVWGMPCHELSATWASQRIGIPNMWQAIKEAVNPPKEVRATAISQFYYPRKGFGMFPDSLKKEIIDNGGKLHLGATVSSVRPKQSGFVITLNDADGSSEEISADHLVSTIPLNTLVKMLPASTQQSDILSRFKLEYRDIICVFLALQREQVSQDTWTYFPQKELLFSRTHEPKNWSPDMVPSQDLTSLCAEIFSSRGERSWEMSDAEIAKRVVGEMHDLGWINRREVMDYWILRVPNAYPAYRIGYEQKVRAVREYLSQWENLHLVGRTGSFRYMNSDGVIEDVFAFLASVFPNAGATIEAPAVQTGRWV